MVETHAFPTGAYFVENPGWLSGGAVRWAVRLLGLPDDTWGEAVSAAVVTKNGAALALPALREWCKSRLSVYKVPQRLVDGREQHALHVGGR